MIPIVAPNLLIEALKLAEFSFGPQCHAAAFSLEDKFFSPFEAVRLGYEISRKSITDEDKRK